ncbi:MAG: transposon-transfer assisting family protein [Bariatricus sp.]
MKYSIEEMNLICIYLADSRRETIANLQDARSDVDDPDMLQLIEETILYLEHINDEEFQSLDFVPDWDDEPGGENDAAFSV